MKNDRRFLLASSLARLVRKERGITGRVAEGYFPSQPDRSQFVSIEPDHCHLVLTQDAEGATAEERTEVPRSQAEALLDVCAGKVAYGRTRVQIPGGREVIVDRLVTPGALDLVTVEFDDAGEAEAFQPPAWFGPEVTDDPAYRRRSIALEGLPPAEDLGLTNQALDSLLDLLEGRTSFNRYGLNSLRGNNPEGRVTDAFRQLAAATNTSSGNRPSGEPGFDEAAVGTPDRASAELFQSEPQGNAGNRSQQGPEPVMQGSGSSDDPRVNRVLASLSESLGRASRNRAGG